MAEITLDKVIIAHLDKMEALEKQIDIDIDKLYETLNIDELINDPEGSLIAFSQKVGHLLEDSYYPKAADEGIKFAKTVIKDGEIEIPKSKDATLNKELTDDHRQD